jgi:Zn-dependent protease
MKLQTSNWNRFISWPLAVLLVFLLPLLLFLLLPEKMSHPWLIFWFVILGILNLLIIWLVFQKNAVEKSQSPLPPRFLSEQDFPNTVQEVMDVNVAFEEEGTQVFRGNLKETAQSAYQKLKESVAPDQIPLLQQDPRLNAAILIVPKMQPRKKPVRLWLPWLLFALTLATTTWAGALQQGVNLIHEPGRFTLGLPYSVGLMAILGFHEMGHYLTARHYKMQVTPPFFIPVPFALGTFGAFISMRSSPEDRQSLFDVAIAGPLAGLALAIPALIIGLQTSTITPEGLGGQTESFSIGGLGSSILFTLVAKASLGAKIGAESLIELSPLAFAGLLGLLVTALNLLPIGQLDGGHIAQAMFGTRGGMLISKISMWSLFMVAILFAPGLIVWSLVVFFIARRSAPPLNDLTPVSSGRRWLGAFSFFLLATIIIPMPEAFWTLFK